MEPLDSFEFVRAGADRIAERMGEGYEFHRFGRLEQWRDTLADQIRLLIAHEIAHGAGRKNDFAVLVDLEKEVRIGKCETKESGDVNLMSTGRWAKDASSASLSAA